MNAGEDMEKREPSYTVGVEKSFSTGNLPAWAASAISRETANWQHPGWAPGRGGPYIKSETGKTWDRTKAINKSDESY